MRDQRPSPGSEVTLGEVEEEDPYYWGYPLVADIVFAAFVARLIRVDLVLISVSRSLEISS